MPKKYTINFPAFSLGLDVSKGEKNLEPGKNIESMNMRYVPEGGARTALGYAPLLAWNFGVDAKIDGLHASEQYPGVAFIAVGGSIFIVNGVSGTPYNIDTGLTMTAGVPVYFTEYRGQVYFTNGVDPMGRIAIGQLSEALSATPSDYTVDIVSSATYDWTQSPSLGANVYYLQAEGGGQTGLNEPLSITENGTLMTKNGSISVLAAGEWGWGNADSLGYNTIYVRLADSTDPDTKANGWLVANYGGSLVLEDAEGYKFTNAADKLYVNGDEIDYTGVSEIGFGDRITGLTNIANAHAAGSYVTQYIQMNTDIKPTFLSIFRNTMWAGGDPTAPNLVYYSKTVSGLATLNNVSDFSDGENYMIGEGGETTASHTARDRIYIFTRTKTFYITIEVDPTTGQLVFSEDILFTPLYGTPNPYCITEMEDVTIFFTGKRLIRIGFAPYTNQLIPDDSFDAPILPLLQDASQDQTHARVAYDPSKKLLYITYNKGGTYTTIVYDNQNKTYSYPDDHDPSMYMFYNGAMYFGSKETDEVMKMGSDVNINGIEMPHRLKTGRVEYEKGRVTSKYIRGYVDGLMTPGTVINFVIYINGIAVGGIRQITDEHASLSGSGTPVGRDTTGVVTFGSGGSPDRLFPFKYPFVIMAYGEDIAASWSSLLDGASWQIDNMTIEAKAYGKVPYTHH